MLQVDPPFGAVSQVERHRDRECQAVPLADEGEVDPHPRPGEHDDRLAADPSPSDGNDEGRLAVRSVEDLVVRVAPFPFVERDAVGAEQRQKVHAGRLAHLGFELLGHVIDVRPDEAQD